MSASLFDVVAVGDTTQDVFLQMSDASLQCDIDGKNCRLCFDYAEKIAVDKKTDVPAVGNAANHAIGAARLGLRAALYTIVGDDVQGHVAADVLKENHVDTRYVEFDTVHGTNFSAVINFKAERTIFVYHEPRTYQLPTLEPTTWIYLTSASGEGVVKLHADIVTYLEEHPEVKLAFNPGTHQMNLGRELLLPLFKRAQMLFLNREESARVLGIATRDIKTLAQGFHEIGVPLMIITDGPDGSYVSDGTHIWFLKIFRGPVVERTGCGDAYGSGFLSGIVKGKSVPEAMLWGNANSTSVVAHIGAREGLLAEPRLQQLIRENTDIIPEKFDSL
ncbi:MAG: carbohydrate kinase family protein [Candidatus Andersenbacteria bacterium]